MASYDPQLARLERFLLAARRRTRALLWRRTGLTMAALGGLCALVAAAFTATTGRGDLARAWLLAALCGAGTWLLGITLQDLHRHTTGWARLARHCVRWMTLAGTGTAQLQRDLVAAADLGVALRRGEVQGDPRLARAFTASVGATLPQDRRGIRGLLPSPRRRARRALLAVVLAGLVAASASPSWRLGLWRAWYGVDASPPPPPSLLWTQLDATVRPPLHTRRPERTISNPTAALRVAAGTEISLAWRPEHPSAYAWLEWSPGLERRDDDAVGPAEIGLPGGMTRAPWRQGEDGRWQGSFTASEAGQWRFVSADGDHPEARTARRSPWQTLVIEADAPPEVKLSERVFQDEEATSTDVLEIPMTLRDDFGIAEAHLVYEDGQGEVRRLPIETFDVQRTRWRGRFSWDLSAIPIERRGDLVWWIEARDNDPGLGPDGPLDPPGKLGRSPLQRLEIVDEEAEHLENLIALRELRDQLVDRLGARLETDAFDGASPGIPGIPRVARRAPRRQRPQPTQLTQLTQLRGMLMTTEAILSAMGTLVERLAMDMVMRPRDVENLAAIQRRLFEVFRPQRVIIEELPAVTDGVDERLAGRLLRRLRPHHGPTVSALEDEIIRVDDLVDAAIIRRFERQLASLEAAQRRLAELLSQLAVGDESVLPEVELLRARIRQDTAELNRTRAWLRRAFGEEFMNTEAFAVMLRRMQSLDVDRKLADGDYQGALEQTQEALQALREGGDAARARMGDEGGPPQLSEEDKARARLLRTLSRLYDEQEALEQRTAMLDRSWRGEVDERADSRLRDDAQRRRGRIDAGLESVNDARLSRPGRVGFEDAEIALEALERDLSQERPRLLDLYDQLRALRLGLEAARRGAGEREREAKALRRLSTRARALDTLVREALPDVRARLSEGDQRELQETTQSQVGLRERTSAVLDNSDASFLPAEGGEAVRAALEAMGQAREHLDHPWLEDGALEMKTSKEELQRAIDSLRDKRPPPPAAAGSPESSTAATRRAGLRKAVMEAMKHRPAKDAETPVDRFYEELLR